MQFQRRRKLLLAVSKPIESISFIAVVKRFNTLATEYVIEAYFSELPENQPSGFIHRLNGSEITFHINLSKDIHLYSYKVSILDNLGIWQDCGQGGEQQGYGMRFEFPLTKNFTTLMENKQLFLRNDMIDLRFEMNCFTRLNTMAQKIPSSEKEKTSDYVANLRVPVNEKKRKNPPSTLADDLTSLYKEGTLCDTKLRTDSETFPVHKNVLSARSPVFKNMFTSGMIETTGDCVDIPDISADTVRRLLMFIYTDTVKDMTWQNAMELYAAADKYQIDSLKLKCSTFFRLNVQPTNCCDLLWLSDLHQDADLKQFVQRYIVTRDKDVFGSEEWRAFMSNNVQLAADTMYLKYASK
ncbi:speckle-type POZ protein-like B [Argiope bruennichi]|uniref:Speckle-type POZ protein like n=1 Tax=Argiope bruennichi TaxID=94029 RepID=A0A8T0EDT6_ARGBR|nr:speckle-type POZ protein-like B [Argiope bruennichi]KAF8770887.1 Speckle-type POZ protein like [Argiope bruennichi]